MKHLLLLTIVLFSCTIDKEKLYGRWQAAAFYQNGQTVNTPLDSVCLEFGPPDHYRFTSIGFYEEAGVFRVAGKRLYLKDSSAHAVEQALEVLFLSKDTLKIGMRDAGNEQTVFFGKKNQ